MSEVTTLKQLMLDAARYRYWRANAMEISREFCSPIMGMSMDPDRCDAYIDEALDSE